MIILSQQQAYPRKLVIITTPLIMSEIENVHTSEEEDEDDDNTVFTKLATFFGGILSLPLIVNLVIIKIVF